MWSISHRNLFVMQCVAAGRNNKAGSPWPEQHWIGINWITAKENFHFVCIELENGKKLFALIYSYVQVLDQYRIEHWKAIFACSMQNAHWCTKCITTTTAFGCHPFTSPSFWFYSDRRFFVPRLITFQAWFIDQPQVWIVSKDSMLYCQYWVHFSANDRLSHMHMHIDWKCMCVCCSFTVTH